MSGNKIGGIKARDKNIARDPNWYSKIGKIGGKNGNTGGFADNRICTCNIIEGEHTKPQCAGKIGGMRSKRTKK